MAVILEKNKFVDNFFKMIGKLNLVKIESILEGKNEEILA